MSFDGTVALPVLDDITIIAYLGACNLDATTVTYTRISRQLRYMRYWAAVETTDCLKCLCKWMATSGDGRAELLDAVQRGAILIHRFAPKSDLFECGCRVLPSTRPKGGGTWKNKTHQF